MNEMRERLAFVTTHVDYFLWKNWDPIGGGQIGLPRDEYISYTPAIVGKLFESRDEKEIAATLHRFAYTNMGLNSTIDSEILIARELLKIPLDKVLPRTDLQFWESEVENGLALYFSSIEFPNNLVYVDLQYSESNHPLQTELFSTKWREILDNEFD